MSDLMSVQSALKIAGFHPGAPGNCVCISRPQKRLAMWLGVSREQFIKPKKVAAEGVTDDGACV